MSEEDKTKSTKSAPIKDVTDADKVAPSDTSKSIITSRPMVKDAMVKEEAKDAEVEQDAGNEEKTTIHDAPKLAVTPSADIEQPAEDAKPTDEEPAEEPAEDDKKDDSKPEDPTAELKEADIKKAEYDVEIDKLIDSKKYELPITTMEKRRSTRFVILGLLVAIFLILAWVDIALDAQLIQIEGLNPVTHIFSN